MNMKQLFLFLLFSTTIYSQDFSNVDDKVLNYPKYNSVEALAERIQNDFDSDLNKARAAFYWLSQNIRYNLKEFYNPKQRSYSFSYSSEAEKEMKLQRLKDNLVKETFLNKSGVCEEYAQSFKKICDLLGIEAAVIKGYVRNDASEIGKVPNRTNHAWNAVKIDDNWLILDATWAAGFEYNGRWVRKFNDYFFNIPTHKIFKTHYPEDSIWVLRFGRMTIDEFYKQPIYKNNFLSLSTELLSPNVGILRLENDDNIILKFKNANPSDLVFYVFKGMRNAIKPDVKTEDGITTMTIQNPGRNTDLILYINKVDALHFKVKVN